MPPSKRTSTNFAREQTFSMWRSTEYGCFSWPSDASRRLGCRPPSWPAASSERSLAAKDRATMSAGDCSRSTACAVSSKDRRSLRTRCMVLRRERRSDGGAVETFLPDHYKPAAALFVGPPQPVELMREPRADALHQQAHRLARDFGETLYPQHIVFARQCGKFFRQSGGVRDGFQRDDEGVEIVVVMALLGIVMGRTRQQIVLGSGGETEQHIHIQPALARRHNFHRTRNLR